MRRVQILVTGMRRGIVHWPRQVSPRPIIDNPGIRIIDDDHLAHLGRQKAAQRTRAGRISSQVMLVYIPITLMAVY